VQLRSRRLRRRRWELDDRDRRGWRDPSGDPEAGRRRPRARRSRTSTSSRRHHLDKDFTASDYPTNPPTGGDHNPNPLQAGTYYEDPPRLGEAVHLLEHGAVIGWTNNLSTAEQKAVEDEFNAIFQDRYYQLAVVENPDLDVPFALSAWGALQTCKKVDTSVIRPFVEEWYASPKTAEGGLACQGDARTLPNC